MSQHQNILRITLLCLTGIGLVACDPADETALEASGEDTGTSTDEHLVESEAGVDLTDRPTASTINASVPYLMQRNYTVDAASRRLRPLRRASPASRGLPQALTITPVCISRRRAVAGRLGQLPEKARSRMRSTLVVTT